MDRKTPLAKVITILAASSLVAVGLTAPVAAQPAPSERSGGASTLGVSPATRDFVRQAGVAGQFAVQSSQLALERSTDPAVRSFAELMVRDHTRLALDLKALVAKLNLDAEPPAGLDDAHQKEMDKLRGLSGSEFVDEYIDMLEDAHEDSVSLFRRYAADGDVPALKDWAGITLPVLQHHHDMADRLD